MSELSYPSAADDETLALRALGWIVSDPARTDRLLALTGLDRDSLRAGLGTRAVLAAVLGFLADHEPDLMACAQAIGVEPAVLAGAAGRLGA